MTTPAGTNRWFPLLFFVAAAMLFYVANRAAYKGYFSDDDLDNLGWPVFVGNNVFFDELVSPKFSEDNFRPVGLLYYRYLGRAFNLHFEPYVAVVQGLHILNVVLVFFILRRLNFLELAAGAGALFYAFHAAVMEAYWKPMFVFDVLCGTLCLITLLLYLRGHWILALLPFWLSYKTKEIAVMLPFALLAYELFLNRPNTDWRPRILRLVPYFLISLSFGLQALWHNRMVDPTNSYSLHFTPALLWKCIAFYSSQILFLPFVGLAILVLPFFLRDRRLYFGIAMMALLLVPLIVLQGRLHSVYWYVPLIGLAVAVAAIASRTPRWGIALFFILWLPLNYVVLREKRRAVLADADESRWYLSGLRNFARRAPPLNAVVYDSIPGRMHSWGVAGAIHQVFGWKAEPIWSQDPKAQQAMSQVPMALVSYVPAPHIVKGLLRTRNELQSEIRFADKVPESQFGKGWFEYADNSADYRWASPKAEITLYRPGTATEFEVACFQEVPSKITVLEEGQSLGSRMLNDSRGQTLRWTLSAAASGDKHITILSEPARHGPGDTKDYGIAIKSLGYEPP